MLVVVVLALAVSQVAVAKDGDVIRRATCSAGSTVKLKLSKEDGGIEIELEVDQNRSGVVWRVSITRVGGGEIFAGRRTTRGPSGSFEVRRVTPDAPGPDIFRARATRDSGEVCRVSATFTGVATPDDSGGSSGGDDSGSDDHGSGGHGADDA